MSVLAYLFVGTIVLALWYLAAVIICLWLDIDFFIGLMIAPLFLMLLGALGKLALTIF